MAKMPRYMKQGPLVKNDKGHATFSVIINTRHPLFLLDVIKEMFARYEWWHLAFWRGLFYVVFRWVSGWNRE